MAAGEPPAIILAELRARHLGVRPARLPRCDGCARRAWLWHRQGPFASVIIDGIRHHARPDGDRLLCGLPAPVAAS